jgi:acyl-CoA synthetase (AMP-forming)/AMP-acid ligase II
MAFMTVESAEVAGSTYWNLVDDAARLRPRHVVLSDDYGRELTTRDLRTAGLRTAAALAERGVTAGTVVSWQLPTTLETMVVMVALSRLGAVQNPILPIWRKTEVTHALSQIGAEVYIVPRAWRGFDHVTLAQQMSQSHGTRSVVLDFDGPPENSSLRLPAGEPDRVGTVSMPAGAVRWIYYSSGTTSAPKGIQHSDATIIAGTSGILNLVGTAGDEVYPVAFPVSHIGGAATLAAALMTGMRLVLFDAFDPATTPFAMAVHRPTLLGSATPFFAAYLAAQDRHGTQPLFPDLRGCTGGGAPITVELAHRVRDRFGVPGIANAWGLTEFPVATTPSATAGPEVLDQTVGRPATGVQIRVVGPGERDAEPGAPGELRLKGPQCFLGYVDTALDADAFDAEGWFRTGDQGCVGADGNVRVTGRLKDAIIRNAENISALEVEEAVATHAHVDDVAVIGIPDERTGERVCAIVVPRTGSTVTVADLAAHCDARGLSKYKWPERVELVDALPRNLTGKVLKAELRQRFS